ncbi:MAG: hypothetical protein EA372_12970 [Chromatiaceae bacterium]|nr:MAG: hypothetical protein EA372_12970 [Chromatiaceae bacterium]
MARWRKGLPDLSTGYHVEYRNPWLRTVVRLVLVLLVLGAGWQLYHLGYAQGGDDYGSAKTELRDLRERVALLGHENRQLRQDNALLQRELTVEREVSNRVRLDIQGLERRVHELTEEVDFYRNIVSPDELERGLHIHKVQLTPADVPGAYRYQLVLTQVQGNRSLEGRVNLQLEGRRNGESIQLEHGDLVPGEADGRSFSFRYFQVVSGRLHLPGDVVPEALVVSVEPEGSHARSVQQREAWSSLFNEGDS